MSEKLKLLSLFAGIGGFELGLERTGGFETVAQVEIDPFCRKVLAKHWPEVPKYEDVATFEYIESVDMVTAGFPCQDISLAGKGAGLAGERSGLFWHILRTVRMVGRPALLLENVAALLYRGMGPVLGALAESGYDAEWDCLPACAFGLPHHRERIWIVADPCERRRQGDFPQALRRLAPLPWSENVRRATNWRKRPDLYTPMLCGAGDGIPNKVDRLGAIGNAVAPLIPEAIGFAYLENLRDSPNA